MSESKSPGWPYELDHQAIEGRLSDAAERGHRAEQERARLALAFRSTFTDRSTGRPHINAGPVLRYLARFSGFNTPSRAIGGPVDPYGLAVIEGRRQVFIEILRQAGIDPLEACPSFD